MIWSELQSVLRDGTSFMLSTHVNPDGDCIGSQLALHWYLTSLGKKVTIYNSDSVPNRLLFLKNTSAIRTERPTEIFDVAIILDASNPSRLGIDGVVDMAPVIVNIDHHRDNTSFGHINCVDTGAAATSQILFRFLQDSGVSFPAHVAEYLYVGILTDTGGFQFSNTNDEVLRVSAELAARGADCASIYRNAYASHSPNGLLLRARIWSTLRFYFENRVCSMEMPMDLAEQLDANYGDAEGMSSITVTAEGVQLGMLIKFAENTTHFSLRGRDGIDVGRMAQQVPGGGGHSSAAGCTFPLPLEQAREKMLEMIRKEIT